jgi:hypothetical protein
MGIKARLTDWQASPSLRNSFVSIPGKAGVADFGSDSAEKTITVRCNIYPKYGFKACSISQGMNLRFHLVLSPTRIINSRELSNLTRSWLFIDSVKLVSLAVLRSWAS